MKVKELIKILSKLDQEKRVVFLDGNYQNIEIVEETEHNGEKIVSLE